LGELHEKCVQDAEAEAAQFTKFDTFCTDKNDKYSASIATGKDDIEMLSAEIKSKTATRNEKNDELLKTKAHKEKKTIELEETTARCEKEKESYLAENDDTVKALNALSNAIQSLTNSKPGAAAKLVALRTVVHRSPALNAAIKTLDGGVKWSSLLQVDPSDPEFKFHSDGILDLLKELESQFSSKKELRDEEWTKTSKSCTDTKATLESEIATAGTQIGLLEVTISELDLRLSQANGELVEADTQLKDDELYFRDLTKRCTKGRRDNDQRSQARKDEIEALAKALDILGNKVRPAADVNLRALVQKKSSAFTFIQTHSAANLEGGLGNRRANRTQEQGENQKKEAMKLLNDQGRRLKSATLLSLVSQAGADPFKKVKTLIEKLMERLISEANAEATKKGFCDQAMGKATKSREFRHADATRLSAQIGELESKKR